MRFGIVTTSYPREPGEPAGSFVASHAAWLAEQGHEVDVVAAGEVADVRSAHPAVKIRRVRCGARLFYGGGAPERLADAAAWPEAIAFSLRLGVQVAGTAAAWDRVIAHWLVPSAVAAALCTPRHIPLTAIAHSGDVHLLRRIGAAPAVAALLISRRARICFVSESVRETFLSAIAPGPVRARALAASIVCAMGIDVARLDRPARRQQPPLVLFLGRLVDVKGPLVLAEAARRLRQPARVVIAGDGPLRPELERCAQQSEGRLCLIGQVRGRERDVWLSRASVLVCPSVELADGRTEGMPVVALEAMAARVPVVASAVGGLRELPAAAHVQPRDPVALAEAIDRVLRDGPSQPDLSRARELARCHDWSVVGPRLL
jgi:glycosyltransferase involved in cell wall biosynthesis